MIGNVLVMIIIIIVTRHRYSLDFGRCKFFTYYTGQLIQLSMQQGSILIGWSVPKDTLAGYQTFSCLIFFTTTDVGHRDFWRRHHVGVTDEN